MIAGRPHDRAGLDFRPQNEAPEQATLDPAAHLCCCCCLFLLLSTKQTCSAFVPGRAGVIAEDNLRTHLPAGDLPGSCFTLLGFAIGGRPNPDGNRLLQAAAIPRCHLPVCVPHYPAVTFQEATMCG